ncbi:MAG TPA: type II secretion system protein [Fimbriimonadaceae bacterium]|nr:type II secretion system protein [Fimbriimonadaceae bacterium]HRJ34167.1 type II secretion system protein [Fimbriimonadaceae bacterium]
MNFPQKQRGITLIEVLISIAIIGFLLGVILIVVRPMMVRKAYDTEAIAGLRGWYNAYTMYRTDNDDKEPRNFWHFLSYNPGAEWKVPKSRVKPDCKFSNSYYYARVHPIPHFAQRSDMINRYDPQKEGVIRAPFRCRLSEGRIEYFVYSPKFQKEIRQSMRNLNCPTIMEGGNVKWSLVMTPFEAERSVRLVCLPKMKTP